MDGTNGAFDQRIQRDRG